MTRLLLIGFLFFSISNLVCGTLPKSVSQIIEGKSLKMQVKLLDSIATVYRNKDFVTSINISNYALSLAKKENIKLSIIRIYLTICRTQRTHGNHDIALLYADSAKKFAFANTIIEQYANIYDFEGLVHMRKGDYENATKCFFKCIEYAERRRDSTNIHNGFEHLGSVSFYRRDYKSAVKFYRESIRYTSPEKNLRQYISTLDNIGLGFCNLAMYDSALFYQKRSVGVIEQLKDSNFIAECYINLASTLMNLKQYKEAGLFIKKAFDINNALSYDYGIQLSNLYMGKFYLQTNKVNEALPYFLKAHVLAKKLKNSSQKLEAARCLSEIYYEIGDYRNAVIYLRQTTDYMEAIAKENNENAINELSAKYEAEKKQKEIQLLTKDKQLKENIIQKDKYVKIFVGSIAILLLLLSIIFIFRFKEKKKDNNLLIEKNEAIALQNKEIELQKTYIQQKNTEITDSIMYAKRIQASVLPSVNLIKNLFPQSFIYFQPKDIVSGDFYWIAQNANYFYYALADCTGHGVPGAMMSMLGASLLNQIVINSKVESPDDILKELHFHVVKTLNENIKLRDSKDGMDIALIRIDLKKREVVYAGAGRPLYIIKNNQLEIYRADKYSIGSTYDTHEVKYNLHEIKIDTLTQLYMFTDGLPDQFGGTKGKKFMIRQLQEFLIQTCTSQINEQERHFKDVFESWKGNVEQTDDVTLVSIRLS